MSNSISVTEETLDEEQAKHICESLQNDDVRIVSFRECKLSFSQLKNILKYVEQSKSLKQLSLNIGIISDQRRIDLLCRTIKSNRYLQTLLIHGNNIGDKGMKKIARILLHHPSIVCLDVGDCNIGDESLEAICNLLPPHGKKSGLIELTMSSNPKITQQGWIKLSVSMAASSCLQELYLDYNTIGDLATSSVLVGLASHRHLQVLDLEGTCITDRFAELLLYLIENYPTKLQKVGLEENNIEQKLLKTIKSSLLDVETESEISDKTQNQESSEESSNPEVFSEPESGVESIDGTPVSQVKVLEAKATSSKATPQKSLKHKSKKSQAQNDTLISLETTWDGEELIEITEPPLVRGTQPISPIKGFEGVNLGQVVSVTSGKGMAPEGSHSDEELTEIKPFSNC